MRKSRTKGMVMRKSCATGLVMRKSQPLLLFFEWDQYRCEVLGKALAYVRFQLGAFHMLGSSLEPHICEGPVWSLTYVRSTLYVYTDVRFRNHKLEMWGSELVFKQMLGFSKGYFYMLGSEVVEPNIWCLCKLKPTICFNTYLGHCRNLASHVRFQSLSVCGLAYVRL